jgi:hypothetical protein
MYIARAKWPSKNAKVYESIYLRQSYRQGGKVQQRNIAKLTHCPAEVIAAMELSLKSRGDLAALRSLKYARCGNLWFPGEESGPAVWVREADGCGRSLDDQERTDRGLSRAGFHYITAITKPEIMMLVHRGVVQMELFDVMVCEVEHEGVRYILRRNPLRAKEMAAVRGDKVASLERFVQKQNLYLAAHPRARVSTAQKAAWEKFRSMRGSASRSTHAEPADR